MRDSEICTPRKRSFTMEQTQSCVYPYTILCNNSRHKATIHARLVMLIPTSNKITSYDCVCDEVNRFAISYGRLIWTSKGTSRDIKLSLFGYNVTEIQINKTLCMTLLLVDAVVMQVPPHRWIAWTCPFLGNFSVCLMIGKYKMTAGKD